MPLVLRSTKGSELSFSEMDGNFTFLENLAEISGATGAAGATGATGAASTVAGATGATGANGVVDNADYVRNTDDTFIPSVKITQIVTLTQLQYNTSSKLASTLYVII
tara:strand:+ start:312 stop:635 length:324 start_codon:yes stop_codon:yes gene_type:complete